MILDPTMNATNTLALITRCDYGQFQVTSGSSPVLAGEHPMQAALAPATASTKAFTWAGVYRAQRLAGEVLVVDDAPAALDMGLAATLYRASQILDEIDLRMLGTGNQRGDPYQPNPIVK